MAQSIASKNSFTLAGGLLTEASPLAFPEGYSVDELNFRLENDLTRRRREGFEHESETASTNLDGLVSQDDAAIGWPSVNDNPDVNFLCFKVGRYLHITEWGESLDGNVKLARMDLLPYFQGTDVNIITAIPEHPITGVPGRGKLYLVGRYLHPIRLSYDEVNDTFDIDTVHIAERDFRGVDEDIAVDERPTVLTDEHDYNLKNQGWTSTRIAEFNADPTILGYPSNADIMQYGWVIDPATGEREFVPEEIVKQELGKTRAPRGRFIVSAFQRGAPLDENARGESPHAATPPQWSAIAQTITLQGAVAGPQVGDLVYIRGTKFSYVDSITGETMLGSFDGPRVVTSIAPSVTYSFAYRLSAATGPLTWIDQGAFTVADAGVVDEVPASDRPSAVGFYAGRIWYGSFNSTTRRSTLYFSRILQEDEDAGRCYQAADPTNEHDSALVSDDGGTISIPNMGRVHKLVEFGGGMLAFAEHGVWRIGAGSQGVFTADSFESRRIDPTGVDAPNSVIVLDDQLLYWTKEGIHKVSESEVSGEPAVLNLSQPKINQFFHDIDDEARTRAYATYVPAEQMVYWFYPSDITVLGDRDEVLLYSLKTEGFYPWTIADDTVRHGVPFTPRVTPADVLNRLKMLTHRVSDGAVLYGQFSARDFLDHGTTDAGAVLELNHEIVDDARKDKHTNDIFVFMKKTETGYDGVTGLPLNESSCLMQGRWNWANHTNSGKYSPEQQVYRHRREYIPSGAGDTFDNGEPVVVTRNRVPGQGRALRIRFRTAPLKDCHILGYSGEFVAGERP